MSSPRSSRMTKKCKDLTCEQAAIIIQDAYRKYRHRKMMTKYHKVPSPRRKSSPKPSKEFPWKTNHKIINMFKKMDDLELKYAEQLCEIAQTEIFQFSFSFHLQEEKSIIRR